MPAPAFPAPANTWLSTFPSLLAVANGGDIAQRRLAVTLIAREFVARAYVDTMQVVAGSHFAFGHLSLSGADSPSEDWSPYPGAGGPRIADHYRAYTPPGAPSFGLAVRRMDEDRALAPRRDSAIWTGVLADVLAQAGPLIVEASEAMGSVFTDLRAAYLAELQASGGGWS